MDDFVEIPKHIFGTIAQKYDRSEESLQEDVQKLKSWMEKQPHLPEILDKRSIQNFLILNKCSIERTKQKIDMYYTMRSRIPDMFENINPRCANMKKQLEIGCTVLVPKLTKEMYRVLLFKMLNRDMVDEMDPYNVIRQIVNLQEIRLKEDVMFGDIFIFDMGGLPFSYMMKLTPPLVAKTTAIYEKIYSIPLKAMYFVNSPAYINTFLTFLKSLLKPKLANRVFSCEDTSVLSDFPKDCLTKDYDGEAASVEALCEKLKMKLNQYQDRFDILDTLRVNEDLRPEELKNDEYLGFHGNFKKLTID